VEETDGKLEEADKNKRKQEEGEEGEKGEKKGRKEKGGREEEGEEGDSRGVVWCDTVSDVSKRHRLIESRQNELYEEKREKRGIARVR
jgi:Mg-chelatase subunit ChlD